MTAIPASFEAYVAEKVEDEVERGIRTFAEADLPPGEVEIRVAWSSVNYKDGLATRADGKVARISPLIPGIDLAGEVVASDDPSIVVGDPVLAHGYDLGVSRHGGYSQYQRVPAGWVVPLGLGLSPHGRRWRSGPPGSRRRCPWSPSRSVASSPIPGPCS